MPIVQSLMDNLVKRYGQQRGERIYYAMEAEGSGPFAPGAKHHDLHVAFAKRNGVTPISSGKKKPPRGGSGRAAKGRSYKRKRR